jgi:hypothetical protein
MKDDIIRKKHVNTVKGLLWGNSNKIKRFPTDISVYWSLWIIRSNAMAPWPMAQPIPFHIKFIVSGVINYFKVYFL